MKIGRVELVNRSDLQNPLEWMKAGQKEWSACLGDAGTKCVK